MSKTDKILWLVIGTLIIFCLFMSAVIIIMVTKPSDVQYTDSSSNKTNSTASTSSNVSSEIISSEKTEEDTPILSSSEPIINIPATTNPSYTSEPEEISDSTVIDNSFYELEKTTFKQLYTLTETQYKNQLSSEIQTYKTELDSWNDKSGYYSIQKLIDQRNLMERYANMGLLESGTYKSAMAGLNSKYQNLQAECTNNINYLSNQIKELNSKIQNPDPNEILALLAVNNGMTSEEVVEKYNKYMQ